MASVLDTTEYLNVVAELLEAGKEEIPVPVSGSSMIPFLHPQDQVFLSPIRSPLRPGDIVLYRRASGQYVLHRLYRLCPEGGFEMLGDVQTQPEPIRSRQQLLGVVTRAIHKDKPIDPKGLYWRFYAGPWRRLRAVRPLLLRLRNLLPK